MKIIHVLLVTLRPLQLNLMFVGPDQPFKFLETMFCKFIKSCVCHMSVGKWHRCIAGLLYQYSTERDLLLEEKLLKQSLNGHLVIY